MANNIPVTISDWDSDYTANQPDASDFFNISDDLRVIQAAVRLQFEGDQWRDLGHVPTRTGNTTFTVPGDQTAFYTTGTPIRCDDSTMLYGLVVSSAYTSLTTVTVVLDSGNLSASLTAVALGVENGNGLIRKGVTPTAGDDSTNLATTAYTLDEIASALNNSPALGGNPTAATQATGNNTTRIATTAFTVAEIASVLANSPALGGNPTAATQTSGNNSTRIATTAYVQTEISALAPLSGGAKFWIDCDAAGNINASYNVASITDTGTGIVYVTISTDFSSNYFCSNVTIEAFSTSAVIGYVHDKQAGYVQAYSVDIAGNYCDPFRYYISGHGAQ